MIWNTELMHIHCWQGVLQLVVEEAKELKDSDIVGTSDPYCRITGQYCSVSPCSILLSLPPCCWMDDIQSVNKTGLRIIATLPLGWQWL